MTDDMDPVTPSPADPALLAMANRALHELLDAAIARAEEAEAQVAALREALLDVGAWYRSDADEFHIVHRALDDTAEAAAAYEARVRADERRQR